MRNGLVAVPPSTEPPLPLSRIVAPSVYWVPAPVSVSYTRASCMSEPSEYPAAVPDAGLAPPNELEVPDPLPLPATTLTRTALLATSPGLTSVSVVEVTVTGQALAPDAGAPWLTVPPPPPPPPKVVIGLPAPSRMTTSRARWMPIACVVTMLPCASAMVTHWWSLPLTSLAQSVPE